MDDAAFDAAQITPGLVRRLVASQFPQWAGLEVWPVAKSGWDNRTFHLGDGMLVRLPSAAGYVAQVQKEQRWLPWLVSRLSLPVPVPLGLGVAGQGFPWPWSVYAWLPGESVLGQTVQDWFGFARDLAIFLNALRALDATGGPLAGAHSFFRGASLLVYDAETRMALALLQDRINVGVANRIWDVALGSPHVGGPVWLHGDVAAGNLLVQAGRLSAVIDFGCMAVGDPACDLVVAWTLLPHSSRRVFADVLGLDAATWARARGWALWKAAIVCAGLCETTPDARVDSWRVLHEVLSDSVV